MDAPLVPQPMQRPSHQRIAISTLYDALVIMEAVRIGHLPLIRRRLNDADRDAFLRPGSIWVWEEAKDEGHHHHRSHKTLKRWTDGVKWSQSRMREPFLYYEEVPTDEPTEALRGSRSESRHPSRRDRVTKADGLRKLTFSALVADPPNTPRSEWRKWHLVFYMSALDTEIAHVSSDPLLSTVVPPEGVFFDMKHIPLPTAPRAYPYRGAGWHNQPSPPLSDGNENGNGYEDDGVHLMLPPQRMMMPPPRSPSTPPSPPRSSYGHYDESYSPISPSHSRSGLSSMQQRLPPPSSQPLYSQPPYIPSQSQPQSQTPYPLSSHHHRQPSRPPTTFPRLPPPQPIQSPPPRLPSLSSVIPHSILSAPPLSPLHQRQRSNSDAHHPVIPFQRLPPPEPSTQWEPRWREDERAIHGFRGSLAGRFFDGSRPPQYGSPRDVNGDRR